MSRRTQDLVLPGAVLVTVVVLSVVAPAVLPAEVAVRFRSGLADGVEGMGVAAWPRWFDMVVWPVCAGLFVGFAAYLSPRTVGRAAAREIFAVVHSGALIVLVLRVVTFAANAGQPAASMARLDLPLVASPHAPYEILVFGIGAMGLSYLTAWALSARPRPVAPPPLVLPPTPSHQGVVWVGSARWTWPTAAMASFPLWASAGPVLMTEAEWWWPLALWSVTCLVWMRHVRADVSIGASGILVRTRPLGIRVDIPWEQVGSVEAIVTELGGVRPVQTRGRRHVLLRPGPALRIVTSTHPPFTVTVDDAPTGAAVARNHLQRHHAEINMAAR